MSGMTTERFPCCRCCVDDPVWHEDNPRDTHETDCPTCSRAPLTTEVARLTAENARLREGIAEALDLARLLPEQLECGGNSCHCTACDLVCELGNLLNPPTEGETDDRR